MIDSQIANGGKRTMLMIDGGIKAHNAKIVSSWGVDVAVVGSGLINDEGQYQRTITRSSPPCDALH